MTRWVAIAIPTAINFAVMIASVASWLGAVQATAPLAQRMAVVEEKIVQIQALVAEHYAEEKETQNQIRLALDRIGDLMSDVRVQVGKLQRSGK